MSSWQNGKFDKIPLLKTSKWQVDKMTGVYKTAHLQNSKLIKWQVDKMETFIKPHFLRKSKFMKWQIDKRALLWNSKLMKWQVYNKARLQTPSWSNGKLEKSETWWNGKLTKQQVDETNRRRKKQKHKTCPSSARISSTQVPTEVERGSGFDLLAPFGRFQRWTRWLRRLRTSQRWVPSAMTRTRWSGKSKASLHYSFFIAITNILFRPYVNLAGAQVSGVGSFWLNRTTNRVQYNTILSKERET